MTDEELAKIEARCEAATPGPWYEEKTGNNHDGFSLEYTIAKVFGQMNVYAEPPSGSFPSANRTFIAHARTDIPALIAEVRRLREELARR